MSFVQVKSKFDGCTSSKVVTRIHFCDCLLYTSNDLDLHIDVQDLFGEDLSLRSPNNIRRTYRNYIGNHELVGTNADLGITINKTLVFRPYQDYHTHEEMLAAIEKSKEEAKPDRLVQLETLGKSAQGRDMKTVSYTHLDVYKRQ